MAMTACYRNFDIPPISQGVTHSHHLVTLPSQQQTQKDYSIPLHVDCSVEYELPNQAKPPVGTRIEPLLMIHPCYFRKMESQRRSPFINNMPNQQTSHITHGSMSSNSINSTNSSRTLRQHSSTNLLRQHNHLTQSTAHHHGPLQGTTNMQLPSLTPSSARVRSSNINHQQQINLQQQIDEYVQRQIVQMSAPPPPSLTYTTIINSHNSQLNNQNNSSSSSNNNNNHYISQNLQRATSTWDPYNIPNVGQHHQSQKNNQYRSAKQASHITNSIIEGGGLMCTGRWSDVIEKTSSLAAIPRDYQSGPECIPSLKSNVANEPTTNNMYRNPVGKRDAMLSDATNIYSSENSVIETAIWNIEKTKSSRNHYCESDITSSKTVLNNRASSSNNNTTSSSTSNNFQNNLNYNNHNSAQVVQAAQDQRHILSGKYKQYLRSQRMHPYSMLPNSLTTTAAERAFSQLGTTTSMFQQVSCFNV